MRYDCHIHAELLAEGAKFDRADYLKRLSQSGFDGSALYSPDPVVYASYTPKERMDAILGACRGDDRLVPFYWIEPTDEDAALAERIRRSGIASIALINKSDIEGEVSGELLKICESCQTLKILS